MHSLSGIVALNAAAVRKARRLLAESETNRRCSFAGDVQEGLVLHSAKQRSTVFIRGAQAKAFMAGWLGTNSDEAHDKLVESYFVSNRRYA